MADPTNIFLDVGVGEDTGAIFKHYADPDSGMLNKQGFQRLVDDKTSVGSKLKRMRTTVIRYSHVNSVVEDAETRAQVCAGNFIASVSKLKPLAMITDPDLLNRLHNHDSGRTGTGQQAAARPQELDSDIEMKEKSLPPEELYTWDFCVVFKVGEPEKMRVFIPNVKPKTHESEGKAASSKKKEPIKIDEYEYYMEETAFVIGRLQAAGLKTFCYLSVQLDEIYCLIGVPESRVVEEAAKVELVLELSAKECLRHGNVMNLPLAKQAMDTKFTNVTEKCFDGLFGKFKDFQKQGDLRSSLYRVWPQGPYHGKTPFRAVDRLKMMRAIMEGDLMLSGADLKLRRFAKDKKHPVIAFFPLVKHEDKQVLKDKLAKWDALVKPPTEELRHYLGEQIAMYFAFLSFYSVWLIVPAVLGFIVFIWQLAAQRVDVPVAILFGALMAMWATAFLEAWKRKTKALAVEWGMNDFLNHETDRPEFEGEWEVSAVTGKLEETFPLVQAVKKQVFSQTILWAFVGLVSSVIVSIIFMRQAFTTSDPSRGVLIAAVANALQINVANFAYGYLSVWLNDYENHRTDTTYENALIGKSFMFKFVNSYNSLFIIAFFKKYDASVDQCRGSFLQQARKILPEEALFTQFQSYTSSADDIAKCNLNPKFMDIDGGCDLLKDRENTGDCLYELSFQLGIIFVLNIFLNNLIEICGPIFWGWLAARKQTVTDDKHEGISIKDLELDQSDAKDWKKSEAELQFELVAYDGTFNDYDELVVQFGFVVLFVVAFPLAPLLALLNNIVENRLDAKKILTYSRRAIPKGALSIGTWYTVLEILSWIGIVTNVGIVIFASRALGDPNYYGDEGLWVSLLVFLVVEHVLFGLKALLAYFIPDQGEAVGNHIMRQQYITDVLIGR